MMEQATFCVGKSRVAKVPNLDLDQTKCVCDILPKETGELTAFSQTSWATLTNAAEIRQDFVWELLKSSQISSPRGFYHRRCYQAYTHKKTLQRKQVQRKQVQRKRDTEATHAHPTTSDSDNDCLSGSPGGSTVTATGSSGLGRLTRSKISKTDISACLFCKKRHNKQRKGKKSESLSECMTFQAAEAIREAAIARDDEEVLMELQCGPDAIAAEVWYHRSCYSAYTDKRTIQKLLEQKVLDENRMSKLGTRPYELAFQHLAIEIQQQIIENAESGAAIRMSDLRSRYVLQFAIF